MRRRFRTFSLSIGLAFIVSIAQPARASTVLYRTDAQLVALSARVVHARVVSQRVTRGGRDGLTIYTVTTLDVLEDFTGRPGDTIDVWELGGVIGDEMLYVGGAVTYTVGREVVVCLERGPYGMRSLGMGLSKFDVVRGPAEPRLSRHLAQTAVVGGTLPTAAMTLAEFRRLSGRVTGRPSRLRAAPQQPVELSAAAPFTLFENPGWRWVQADSGTPVTWYKNTTAAPPVTGDAVAEIQTALSAWTTPPSASIILQYAGTTSQAVAAGPWTGLPNGNGVITFEDPDDELSGLTLAIGGGSASTGTGGTIDGVVFNGFNRGFVIFQNAADLGQEFKTSLGFSRVLEHEIGHAIGLGHTDDDPAVVNPQANIMNSACCYAETPTPPALGPDDLAGVNYIYPSNPMGPHMALDKTTLKFGAVTNGATLLTQTSAQVVRLTQTGAGTVTWTAASNQPWLQVSPASGSGSANLSISVVSAGGLPVTGTVSGAITLTFVGASNAPGPIDVGLTLYFNGTSLNPFGTVDTPTDNRTGVTGAVPFTGWALDDIEVTHVAVCRSAVGAEVAPVDPNCGGASQIFVGFAVFIDGARPDVAAVYSTYPANTRGGWGFMVLTNMLPSQGNGTYQFFMWAQDRDGHAFVLGTRTMTCANASATLPFGAIDTPDQGGVASGGAYVNFGWALTPLAKTIPIDGSTITVMVDGVAVGTATYNNFRSDIAALFPGLNNTNGAVGFRVLDTTALTNGLHTIVWVVSDNQGATEGIGSRFFTVSNGAGALTAAVSAGAMIVPRQLLSTRPKDSGSPLLGRRGWNLEAPLRAFEPDASGRIVVRSEEVNRVELHLGAGYDAGYLRTTEGLQALPIGSRLDESTGVFTWAPGVGFVGAYDFVFARSGGERRDVRIILAPKGSGAVGPQVVIDTPRSQQDVGQPFVLAGWASDLSAAQGTGIATLHAWAYPLAGGPPVFLGAAAYGGARPDVAAVHGDQFEASGFGLTVQALTPGNYDLAVFAWSTERADFVPAKVVRITVR